MHALVAAMLASVGVIFGLVFLVASCCSNRPTHPVGLPMATQPPVVDRLPVPPTPARSAGSGTPPGAPAAMAGPATEWAAPWRIDGAGGVHWRD